MQITVERREIAQRQLDLDRSEVEATMAGYVTVPLDGLTDDELRRMLRELVAANSDLRTAMHNRLDQVDDADYEDELTVR